MTVFEFNDYKEFVLAELEARPKRGRGEFMKISKALRVHTTMVTHILRGDHHPSPEQALALAEYLGLNPLETDYFVALINMARASDERSRQYYREKVREYKDKSLALTHRLEFKNKLDESDQAIFYSSWVYSAVRLLTAIPQYSTVQAIAEELSLSRQKVNNVLDFLVSRNLVSKQNDRFRYRDLSTYVDRDSPFASKHNLNWRLKIFERLDQVARNEMVYTNPIIIAESDFERVTELVVKFIEEFRKIADPSPSEILCCLNVDWLKLSTKSSQSSKI
jgi:uncharacterized protein (TIGR02147 family)